jgi:hypothetical protein
MNLVDMLVGRPLATEEDKAERIGPGKGIPVFGLDALSSAAYGPEAALTLLIPLGMAGVRYIWPITISIIVLLGIVYFSYRQTISAYPLGGGSYTFASENLGVWPGLLAAAALMIDYILTAAVGISAGVGALVSAVPSLQAYTLVICLGNLAVLTLVNLRGVQETGGGLSAIRGRRPLRIDSIVQNHVEQRLMNLNAAVVCNKAELAKAVHARASLRTGKQQPVTAVIDDLGDG